VAAESVDAARHIHPSPYVNNGDWPTGLFASEQWAKKPENVKVEWIGIAVSGTKAGVVLASYNAG